MLRPARTGAHQNQCPLPRIVGSRPAAATGSKPAAAPAPMAPPRRRPLLGHAVALAAPAALAGCAGIQNVLNPHGPTADALVRLTGVLFAGAAVIFLGVMGLIAYAVFRRRRHRPLPLGNRFVLGGGLVFPVVTLTVLLVYQFSIDAARTRPPAGEPLRIEVVGNMWWWEVRYPGDGAEPPAVTANELRVPAGRPVELSVTSADVIHSFWVPTLAGKIDLIPGRVNTITFQADALGVVRGQCAEYCGAQHALMAFYVVVETPAAFEEWLARQRRPAPEPDIPFLARGRDAFLDAGCGACHAVRGIGADGQIGPDLTHVGGRLSIAAGTLDNHVGTLAGWIADSQTIKPGNRMPSFDILEGETLRAVAAYLESLE